MALLRIAKALAVAAGCAVAWAAPTFAQQVPQPPVNSWVDQNGVDLISGAFHYQAASLSIGQPGAGGLSIGYAHESGAGYRLSVGGSINYTGAGFIVSVGESSESFLTSGGLYYPAKPTGNTLETITGGKLYTLRDGTKIEFVNVGPDDLHALLGDVARISRIIKPDGEIITFQYAFDDVYIPNPPDPNPIHIRFVTLQSVWSNLGYQIHLNYSPGEHFNFDSIVVVNLADHYCAPTAALCSPGYGPELILDGPMNQPVSVTDALGRETEFTHSGARLTGIEYPTSSSDDVQIAYYTSGANVNRVQTVTVGGQNWSYGYADASGIRTTTVTDPDGVVRKVRTELSPSSGFPLVVEDETDSGDVTTYDYDAYGRVTEVTYPEGNSTEYTYDGRGNVTRVRQYPKSGTGYIDVARATYPSTPCAYAATCNQPTSVTDARNYKTEFEYYSHGGIYKVKSPAPSGATPIGSGTRPETRYVYATKAARYKTGASSWTTSSIIRLTEVSSCATTASCANGADETRTVIAYPSSGTPNNLLPVSQTVRAGNNAVTATTSFTYDWVGNAATVDGPLSGSADKATFFYNDERQQTGAIGPDPDGGGSLKYRATRTTYNNDGQPTLVEQGTTTSASSMGSFAALAKQGVVYDDYGRPIQSILYSGATSTRLAVTQQTYTAAGRPNCTAVRMNPAKFNTPITNACLQDTNGTYGPDRISQTTYDADGRPWQGKSAVDTGLVQNTSTATYTDNGQLASLTDAAGNTTSYQYDVYDRLLYVTYPGGVYEQYGYDANGNVTSYRRRSGQTFTFTYDNLNRQTFINSPGSQLDITVAYDLFGRVTSMSQTGNTVSYGYDQLSRATSETSSVLGTVGYQYDAAGRRTRITWPDSFYVTYDYDVTGAMTVLKENGSTVLASYSYDDLGRRTGIARNGGAGAATTYGYDGASRLSSMVQNAYGTAHDRTLGFSYNPAGQIVSRTDNLNATYGWQVPADDTDTFNDNALNQITKIDGISVLHNANGDTTSDGSQIYTFDHSGRLAAAAGVDLDYDPLNRLHEIDGTATTRLLYSGSQIIAEMNTSGTVQRRYVPGAGVDEPLVWYLDSGTSNKRWLLTDNQGSITSWTVANGTVSYVNTYDEFGQPAASNYGLLQYAGQVYLDEIGVYHARARTYHPRFGRFMSPDPIGYGDGMNMYAYVGNDPINRWDPSGLFQECFYNYSFYYTRGDDGSVVPYEGFGPGGLTLNSSYCRDVFPGHLPDMTIYDSYFGGYSGSSPAINPANSENVIVERIRSARDYFMTCDGITGSSQVLIDAGTYMQTAGLVGIGLGAATTVGSGGAAAELGVPLMLAGTYVDGVGTNIRNMGAGGMFLATGDGRPMVDSFIGVVAGGAAGAVRGEVIESLSELGLDVIDDVLVLKGGRCAPP